MKLSVAVVRIIVGVLFIFSGIVKAIDPLGLNYKMQEFFEVWASDKYAVSLMNWMHSHSFLITVLMITLEVVLGAALLVGWRKKTVLRFLLLLILFFTFLTSYVLFSGKIRSCGCFGDCIPLTPIQTFIKDIILLGMIIFLILKQQFIEPLFKELLPMAIVFLSVIAVGFIQMYVIDHLPLIDCLPYKVGNNILELRKMPADAIQDKFTYLFIYEKENVTKEFTTSNLPDSTWKFVDRKQTLVEKGKNNVPLINDFALKDSLGNDSTEAILSLPASYLLFLKEMDPDVDRWLSVFADVVKKAKQQNIPLYIITADSKKVFNFFNKSNSYNLPVLICDVTAIKTAARANPTLFVMKGAVVQHKYSWADMDAVLK